MGFSFALCAAAFQSAKDILSKKLSSRVDSTTSTFASFAFALPFYVILLIALWLIEVESFTVSVGFWSWVVLRAMSDLGAEWSKMHGMQFGDLSVVSSLFALSPVFLLITSPLITGDVPSIQGACGVIVTVIGTLIVVHKPRGAVATDRRAIIFGLAAAFFFSLNSCFDRLAVQTASAPFSGFVMTLLAGMALVPGIWRNPVRQSGLRTEAKLFWARGGLEIIFMISKLLALQYLQAPYVVAIQRLAILFSIVSGRLVFQEEQFRQRLFGGLVVVIGVAIILLDL
jgi:drug/metabolite transporter (DMT)-like permease